MGVAQLFSIIALLEKMEMEMEMAKMKINKDEMQIEEVLMFHANKMPRRLRGDDVLQPEASIFNYHVIITCRT